MSKLTSDDEILELLSLGRRVRERVMDWFDATGPRGGVGMVDTTRVYESVPDKRIKECISLYAKIVLDVAALDDARGKIRDAMPPGRLTEEQLRVEEARLVKEAIRLMPRSELSEILKRRGLES